MKRRHLIIAAVAVTAAGIIATTQHTGCQAVSLGSQDPQRVLQDKGCTPGVTNPVLTKDVICSPSFRTAPYRNVPQALGNQVYGEYGIKSHTKGQYEIDHLISLELGGSNDIKNLWPEPGFPNEKDPVENETHRRVCSGKMTLRVAQERISTNWVQLGKDEGILK